MQLNIKSFRERLGKRESGIKKLGTMKTSYTNGLFSWKKRKYIYSKKIA